MMHGLTRSDSGTVSLFGSTPAAGHAQVGPRLGQRRADPGSSRVGGVVDSVGPTRGACLGRNTARVS